MFGKQITVSEFWPEAERERWQHYRVEVKYVNVFVFFGIEFFTATTRAKTLETFNKYC